MEFSQDFIHKVLSSSNIIDEISKHTQLQLKSSGYIGLCPYPNHQEKTPSFSVSEEKQVYYCFGCQKSGNIFTFLLDISGMNFFEAIRYLSGKAGLSLPSSSSFQKRGQNKNKGQSQGQIQGQSQGQGSKFGSYQENYQEKGKLFKILDLVSRFFHQSLTNLESQHFVKVYCQKRNLSQHTIQKFQIGWAPGGGKQLTQFLKAKGVPLELALKLGLIRKREKERTSYGEALYYDNFRNRLMFPIFLPQGQCVGFGGRSLGEDVLPKYLNSSESSLFHKGEIFYGLNASGSFIREKDEALIVEGYMDFLSLYQNGVQNSVATLGTALSLYQAKKYDI